MTWRLAPMIGLLAGLAPAMAHAQTNLDKGKSAGQIFASDCAECHKASHGLANGKNSAALTDFLREHYTTSREQAAALAAYVLGGRSSEAQGRGQKPAGEHAKASAEEAKPANRPERQSGKHEEGTPATAKLQRPTEEEAKPADEANPAGVSGPANPAPRRATGQHEHRQETATYGRRKEPKTTTGSEGQAPVIREPTVPAAEPATVAHVPAAAVTEPSASEEPRPDGSQTPSAAAPADDASGETAPVPRDNIAD